MDYFFSFALVLSFLHTFTHVSSTPIFNLSTDEYALLAFKSTVTFDSYAILSHNWSSNISICSWIGVSCVTKHRRVTALNVSNFQLGGTIAPQLGNLTFLQSLDISFNNFTDLIPSELSKLRRLKELNVGFNSFTSEIPSWLGHLSQLQHIYLNNNSFSGTIPLSLFNITKLQTLDMGYNFLDGILPDEIAKLSYLETLSVIGNLITGSIPNRIFNMSSLIEINMRYNKLRGEISNDICSNTAPKLKRIYLSVNQLYGKIPTYIYKCRELEDLRLGENNFSGHIPSVGSLPKLRTLILQSNHLEGDVPNEIKNLTFLEHLNLSDNNLKGELPQELGILVHLEVLIVGNNSLSGSIPSSIFNLSALKMLVLAENQFFGTIPLNIGSRFSLYNLQELYLHDNTLSGEILSFITSNASKLTILSLENNLLSGVMPNFGNLRQLQRLNIWENQLTGAKSPSHELIFLTSLTNCMYLEHLQISDNPLNGILPTSIGNLSNYLQHFNADRCNIKGVIPSEIGNLSGLLHISLSENHMTGFIPRRMGNLQNLRRLLLGDNHLQGDISRDLCKISNLGWLSLSWNMLTGPIPDCLSNVKSLREVYLRSNKLDSTIPSDFWNLKDLLILDLSSNYLRGQLQSQIGNILQGSIPKSLGNVRSLTTLDLSNNNLSGYIPNSLEDLNFLEYFNVSYNKLEGEIPNGIVNSTAQSFVQNSALCGAPKFQVPPCPINHGKSKSIAMIFVKYIVSPLVATTILLVIMFMLIRRSKQVIIPLTIDIPLGNFVRRRISYLELVRGTNSFSETNRLGIGSFGSVYKAVHSDGLIIAVKVFNLELDGATKSFDTESKILSSIRHRNLLPVIGCCTNLEFRALILKYMPNGSLEKWIHSDNYALNLVQRLDIALDVALALEYLHHGHSFPVVHCDIKPSNILLDEDMSAHVGDFGISKLFDQGEALTHTKTLATFGYAAPEYGSEGKVSTNGDIYSYGIMVLEMFTQKKSTDDMFSEELSLKDWVNQALRDNAICKIVAPGLVLTEDEGDLCAKEECLSSILDMTMKCLSFLPYERIDMIQVATHLHKIKAKLTAATEVNNRRRR